MVEKYPDMRFGQILSYLLPSTLEGQKSIPPTLSANAMLSSIYNEEPAVTLARFIKNKPE